MKRTCNYLEPLFYGRLSPATSSALSPRNLLQIHLGLIVPLAFMSGHFQAPFRGFCVHQLFLFAGKFTRSPGHLQVSSFIFRLTPVPVRALRCLLVVVFFLFFSVVVLFCFVFPAQVALQTFVMMAQKMLCLEIFKAAASWLRKKSGATASSGACVCEDKSNMRNNF